MTQPLPSPTYGKPGLGAHTVTCATRIDASPETCLRVCLDTARYKDWNAFVPLVTITHQPDSSSPSGAAAAAADPAVMRLGTRFTFHCNMDVPSPAPHTFTPPAKDSLTATEELVVTRLGPVDEEDVAGDGEINAVAARVFARHGMAEAAAHRTTRRRRRRLRVSWAFSGKGSGRFSSPPWLLRAERTHEFHAVEMGDGKVVTDYLCWETFGGLLSQVVRLAVGTKVQNGFDAWRDGMKRAAEEAERVKK